jgi:hypothetical protein
MATTASYPRSGPATRPPLLHPWLFVLDVVLYDDSEEFSKDEIRKLWHQVLLEHTAAIEEIERTGLTWVFS